MTRPDAEGVLVQMMDAVVEMRSITPAEGELSPKQRAELQRLYNEKVVPLTDLVEDMVNDG